MKNNIKTYEDVLSFYENALNENYQVIFTIVTVLMGYFLLAMSRLAAKQEEHGENNKKIIIVTGILVLMMIFSSHIELRKGIDEIIILLTYGGSDPNGKLAAIFIFSS